MPISSISNHNQTIGVFHHRHKQNNITKIKKDIISSQDYFLVKGRVLQQLAHAGNLVHSGEKTFNNTIKHIQAASFLNLTLFLLFLKSNNIVYNQRLSAGGTSLSSSLPDIGNHNDSAVFHVNISTDNVAALSENNVRQKRSSGCACDVQDVQTDTKAEKRQKARAKAKAKAKAKARAEARTQARAEAQSGARAAVRAEMTGSATRLIEIETEAGTGTSVRIFGLAAVTSLGAGAGVAGIAGATGLGGVAGAGTAGLGGVAGAGTAGLGGVAGVGTVGIGGMVGIGTAGVAGVGAAASKDAETAVNNNVVHDKITMEQSKKPTTHGVTISEKNRAPAIHPETEEMSDEDGPKTSELLYMQPYHVQGFGGTSATHEVDIGNVPRLTKFIHPMNYYRWLFKQDRTDQFEAINRQIKNHYRTEDVYIHYFRDLDANIPPRFHYLRNNIGNFRAEINKANDLVNQALHKFKRTTIRNDFGDLQYPPQNRIKTYLKGALGTSNVSILHEAMLRLEYYLLELKKYFDQFKDNIIFASSKTLDTEYIHNSNAPVGFTMPLDSGNRVVIMVDLFDGDIVLNSRLHITALHEVSHIQAGSRDFVYSPITRLVGDASEILELFNEAMYFNGNEAIACDELFLQSYENFLDINVSPAQFIQLIKNDPMLQRNIMMDNADSIAQYISDIALSRAYNHDYITEPRNKRSADQAINLFFKKTILNLLVKQRGVA